MARGGSARQVIRCAPMRRDEVRMRSATATEVLLAVVDAIVMEVG